MATDDERRRVAAELREYDGRGADADTIGEVTAIIIGAGDADGWSWREIYARLADLIEPEKVTGETSDEGFWDLYDRALDQAKRNIALFDSPDFNLESARTITAEKNFSGKPTTATIVAVE